MEKINKNILGKGRIGRILGIPYLGGTWPKNKVFLMDTYEQIRNEDYSLRLPTNKNDFI